jgi:multiple sugar transport system permease protein
MQVTTRSKKTIHAGQKVIGHLVSILACLVFAYPILWILITPYKPPWQIYREPRRFLPEEWDFSVISQLFRASPIETWFLNSVLYTVGAVTIALAFSLMAAFVISRNEFRAKKMLLVIVLITNMIPPLVAIVPTYLLMQALNLYDTRYGMVILYGALRIPWGIWLLVGYLNTIPESLDESAYIDGATPLQVLRRIVFPLAIPGMATAAIFMSIATWNEFAIASIVLRDSALLSLPVGVYSLIAADPQDWRMLMSASTFQLLPLLLVFIILQRYIVSGLTAGALKD